MILCKEGYAISADSSKCHCIFGATIAITEAMIRTVDLEDTGALNDAFLIDLIHGIFLLA